MERKITRRKSRDTLFAIAESQQGYFTSQQAEKCGIARSNFHHRIRSGEWAKVIRGVYRLVRYPLTVRDELVLWQLWSRDKQGGPEGVWSHETALDIYDLCDVMPAKMHMTVPKRFRERAGMPKFLILHAQRLGKKDIIMQNGYWITTPLRTLLDVIMEESVTEDQIMKAVREASRRGILTASELEHTPALARYRDAIYRESL